MKSTHPTYWYLNNNCNSYPTKRYILIFDKYRNYASKNQVYTEYDTIEEANEEAFLINEFYKDTPKPVRVKNKYSKMTYEFPNNAYFWGYIILDMEDMKLIEIGHDGIKVSLDNIFLREYHIKKKSDFTHQIKDIFFRKESEVPEKYVFDDGEYEGWLQYRWGDGMNAINKPKKEKTPKIIIVNWEDPLPEKIKGVTYLRPNNEPVLFPGDFGYEGDLNMNPWSLTEEVAWAEYENPKNTFTLSGQLGEDNPLLKLKFD